MLQFLERLQELPDGSRAYVVDVEVLPVSLEDVDCPNAYLDVWNEIGKHFADEDFLFLSHVNRWLNRWAYALDYGGIRKWRKSVRAAYYDKKLGQLRSTFVSQSQNFAAFATERLLRCNICPGPCRWNLGDRSRCFCCGDPIRYSFSCVQRAEPYRRPGSYRNWGSLKEHRPRPVDPLLSFIRINDQLKICMYCSFDCASVCLYVNGAVRCRSAGCRKSVNWPANEFSAPCVADRNYCSSDCRILCERSELASLLRSDSANRFDLPSNLPFDLAEYDEIRRRLNDLAPPERPPKNPFAFSAFGSLQRQIASF